MNDSVDVEQQGERQAVQKEAVQKEAVREVVTPAAPARVPANFKELLIIEDSDLADGVCAVLDARGIPFIVRSMSPIRAENTNLTENRDGAKDGLPVTSHRIRFGISVPTQFLQRASVCAWQVRAEKKSIQSQRREGTLPLQSAPSASSTLGMLNCGTAVEEVGDGVRRQVGFEISTRASVPAPKLWMEKGPEALSSKSDSMSTIPSILWGRASSEGGVIKQSEIGSGIKVSTRPLRTGALANAWLITSRG